MFLRFLRSPFLYLVNHQIDDSLCHQIYGWFFQLNNHCFSNCTNNLHLLLYIITWCDFSCFSKCMLGYINSSLLIKRNKRLYYLPILKLFIFNYVSRHTFICIFFSLNGSFYFFRNREYLNSLTLSQKKKKKLNLKKINIKKF